MNLIWWCSALLFPALTIIVLFVFWLPNQIFHVQLTSLPRLSLLKQKQSYYKRSDEGESKKTLKPYRKEQKLYKIETIALPHTADTSPRARYDDDDDDGNGSNKKESKMIFGDLYLPCTLVQGLNRPPRDGHACIILCPIAGMTRNDLQLSKYASHYASNNFAVFLFDYFGWNVEKSDCFMKSEKYHKQIIDPISMQENILSIINYFQTRDEINSSKIALIGYGLSGANILNIIGGGLFDYHFILRHISSNRMRTNENGMIIRDPQNRIKQENRKLDERIKENKHSILASQLNINYMTQKKLGIQCCIVQCPFYPVISKYNVAKHKNKNDKGQTFSQMKQILKILWDYYDKYGNEFGRNLNLNNRWWILYAMMTDYYRYKFKTMMKYSSFHAIYKLIPKIDTIYMKLFQDINENDKDKEISMLSMSKWIENEAITSDIILTQNNEKIGQNKVETVWYNGIPARCMFNILGFNGVNVNIHTRNIVNFYLNKNEFHQPLSYVPNIKTPILYVTTNLGKDDEKIDRNERDLLDFFNVDCRVSKHEHLYVCNTLTNYIDGEECRLLEMKNKDYGIQLFEPQTIPDIVKSHIKFLKQYLMSDS